jgi:hypothetical protein
MVYQTVPNASSANNTGVFALSGHFGFQPILVSSLDKIASHIEAINHDDAAPLVTLNISFYKHYYAFHYRLKNQHPPINLLFLLSRYKKLIPTPEPGVVNAKARSR